MLKAPASAMGAEAPSKFTSVASSARRLSTKASAFAASVGLCLFAANPQDEWWDFDIPTEKYPARSLRRAIKWFRDNW